MSTGITRAASQDLSYDLIYNRNKTESVTFPAMLGSWCSEFLFAQGARASCTVHDLQSLSDAQCQQSHQSRGVAGGRTPLLVFLSMWTHMSVVSCFCPSCVRWPSKQWAVTGCAVRDHLGSVFTAHVLESEVCGLRLQTVWWRWGWRGGSSAYVRRHSSQVIPAHALHGHVCPVGCLVEGIMGSELEDRFSSQLYCF